jgi:hypothetical protein
VSYFGSSKLVRKRNRHDSNSYSANSKRRNFVSKKHSIINRPSKKPSSDNRSNNFKSSKRGNSRLHNKRQLHSSSSSSKHSKRRRNKRQRNNDLFRHKNLEGKATLWKFLV